jgi:hypothetical protein
MVEKSEIIHSLFEAFADIRYVAIYKDGQLLAQQRAHLSDNSSSETDKYEELLVNPALLTLARQRGNLDCGGLRFLLVGYGHFYQWVKEIAGGHISICLAQKADLNHLPDEILTFLQRKHFT